MSGTELGYAATRYGAGRGGRRLWRYLLPYAPMRSPVLTCTKILCDARATLLPGLVHGPAVPHAGQPRRRRMVIPYLLRLCCTSLRCTDLSPTTLWCYHTTELWYDATRSVCLDTHRVLGGPYPVRISSGGEEVVLGNVRVGLVASSCHNDRWNVQDGPYPCP
eukprot:1562266-Rhodomonas_salina.1